MLSALLLAVVLCSCSGGASAPTEDGIMTEVRDDGGNLTGYERRFYYDDGNISRLDCYDADQVYQSFVLYDYYDSGLLSAETYYRADGIAEYRSVYTYDDDGKLTEKAWEYPDGSAEVIRYDADGNETERLNYDTEGELIVD